MSTAQSFQSAGHAAGPSQSSTGLTLNLSSNNPFRNRAASPASADLLFPNKPASPFEDPPPRPLSRNPFLDQPPQPLRSPGVMSSHSDSKSLSAEEIFVRIYCRPQCYSVNGFSRLAMELPVAAHVKQTDHDILQDSLTLDDTSTSERPKQPAPRRPMDRPPPRRGDNPPPAPNGSHRPTGSQEEALRARRMQGPGPRPQPNSPQRRPPPRRVRRNSESSLMDFDARPLTDEEKRMIEAARRRDHERQRRGDGKERSDRDRGDRDRGDRGERGDKNKSGRPSRRMDIIDQLDATSIYGTGLFHHDGPFDALNPHRNRQSSRRAPMQAFPKDSLNNSLGGAGPLNAQADHSAFMGNATDEAFRDFATGSKSGTSYYGSSSRAKDIPIFDPTGRGHVVHGDESHGLGTSTFLEGTPATRSAIQRHQAEQAQETLAGGMQRKKSLAQRIRHINKGQRDYSQQGRMNADGGYTRITPDTYPSAASTGSDNNPFFAEFGRGEEGFTVRSREGAMSPSSPSAAPRRPSAGAVLERRATTDAATTLEDGAAKPSGFIGRMKSLKGRRPRPEVPASGPTAPGTAV
ncbi:hypothetical protein ACJ41O_009549 [Fusarium nematophilum]